MKQYFASLVLTVAALSAQAATSSFTISFGTGTESTTSLTNATFINSVSAGASYIEKVTSVVTVFPEKDCIRLSSSSKNGKFNIELTEDAQVVARRIIVNAERYDNDRDIEAALMINSETLYITDTEAGDYSFTIPSRPERTLTNLIVDATHRVRLHSITVEYDPESGTVEPEKQTVASPVFTPAGGTVSAGTGVEITCSTPDASIYYTMDGAAPTTLSIPYTGPIILEHDVSLQAFAVKDGMTPSETSTASFTVRNPSVSLVSEFDFHNPESLMPAIATPAQKEYVALDGRSFTDGDVAVSFTASETGNTHVRLYNSYDAGCDLRLYDGDMMTVRSMNPNYIIKEINFTMSLSGAATGTNDINFTASTGEFDWASETWSDTGESEKEVILTSEQQSRIASMTVKLEALSGMRAVEIDHDEQASYYTPMGIHVSGSRLTTGLYIRVAGDKAQKVIIR